MKERSIEIAARLRIGTCESCEAVHIILMDEHGRPFATGMLAPETWDQLVEAVERERELKAADSIGQVAGHA